MDVLYCHVLLTISYVLPEDFHVLISIGSALLVPEPYGVHQLVHDDPLTVTPLTKGKLLTLLAPVNSANVGPTSVGKQRANQSDLSVLWGGN